MNYKNYEMTRDTAGKKFCLNCRPSYTIPAYEILGHMINFL